MLEDDKGAIQQNLMTQEHEKQTYEQRMAHLDEQLSRPAGGDHGDPTGRHRETNRFPFAT